MSIDKLTANDHPCSHFILFLFNFSTFCEVCCDWISSSHLDGSKLQIFVSPELLPWMMRISCGGRYRWWSLCPKSTMIYGKHGNMHETRSGLTSGNYYRNHICSRPKLYYTPRLWCLVTRSFHHCRLLGHHYLSSIYSCCVFIDKNFHWLFVLHLFTSQRCWQIELIIFSLFRLVEYLVLQLRHLYVRLRTVKLLMHTYEQLVAWSV